ncbi:MAG: SurA N-terminal domain-containing protein [Puniceicoccales bacterium]|nr:SurA N-terminal domain-containing protein [Puniceicoccales bacterium]
MIDALQRFLSKHRRWLFACLLALVVVPFVFTIGATPGCVGGAGRRGGKFFSVNISSPREVEDLQRAAAFSLHFANVTENVPLDSAMMARAAWLWIADKLQIPDPAEDALRAFIESRPAFWDDEMKFSEKRYEEFFGALRDQAPELERFIARTLADDWRIGTVANVLAAADFSASSEAKLRARQLATEWTLRVATLRFLDFHPAINIGESDLESFYNGRRELFRTPVMVEFDRISFLEEGGGSPQSDCESGDAAERANEFIYRLCGAEEDGAPVEGEAVAVELGGSREGPFRAIGGAEGDEKIPEQQRRAALQLDGGNRLSGPLPLEGGVCVLVLKRRTEPRDLAFWEVRAAVEQHYRRQKQVDLFIAHATELRKRLLAKMADGEPFEEAAAVLGLELGHPIAPFTVRNLPDEIPAEWIGSFLPLGNGAVTEFLPIGRPDLQLWHVAAKKVPAESALVEDIAAFEAENAAAAGPIFLRQLVEELIVDEMGKLK